MAILLSDAGLHRHLLPLTYTRPVGALHAGILSIAGSWQRLTDLPVGFRTEDYLQEIPCCCRRKAVGSTRRRTAHRRVCGGSA